MNILKYPDPILREKCKSVEKVTDELRQLSQDMFITMAENNGVGLAAPQVGHAIRLIVVAHEGAALVLFNPSIQQKSPEVEYDNEGCLSFPEKECSVKRHKWIKLKYRDENGKMKYLEAHGYLARIIQHEIDHLTGVTLVNHGLKV